MTKTVDSSDVFSRDKSKDHMEIIRDPKKMAKHVSGHLELEVITNIGFKSLVMRDTRTGENIKP